MIMLLKINRVFWEKEVGFLGFCSCISPMDISNIGMNARGSPCECDP